MSDKKLKSFAEYMKDIKVRKPATPPSKVMTSKKDRAKDPKRQRQDWKKELDSY